MDGSGAYAQYYQNRSDIHIYVNLLSTKSKNDEIICWNNSMTHQAVVKATKVLITTRTFLYGSKKRLRVHRFRNWLVAYSCKQRNLESQLHYVWQQFACAFSLTIKGTSLKFCIFRGYPLVQHACDTVVRTCWGANAALNRTLLKLVHVLLGATSKVDV